MENWWEFLQDAVRAVHVLYTRDIGYTLYLVAYRQPPEISLHGVFCAMLHDKSVEGGDKQVAEYLEF